MTLSFSRWTLFLFVVLGLSATTAQAQMTNPIKGKSAAKIDFSRMGDHTNHDIPHRTIVGHVFVADDKPALKAVVYLRDVNTSEVRALNVDENGAYSFGPLSSMDDFELWAQLDDRKTAIKPISNFIDTATLSVLLRFDPIAPPKPPAAATAAPPPPNFVPLAKPY